MESAHRRVYPHRLPSRVCGSVGSLLYLQYAVVCVDGLLKLNARNSPAAGFDFIVAIFTVLGVRKFRRGDLATLLRHQGIGYFGLILAVHTVTVVSAGSFHH